MKEFQEAELE